MSSDARRARAVFTRYEAGNTATQGEGEAVIGDDALSVGPVTVAFQDMDALRTGDYRLELDCWPQGRLVLTQLGRRFDSFGRELARARNQGRVAALLAHGVAMPDVFSGAVLRAGAPRPAELQVYDTHVTVVPQDDDPWQMPFGDFKAVRIQDDPPGVILECGAGNTAFGMLARLRDEFHQSVTRRISEQTRRLVEATGNPVFADGVGVPRGRIDGFEVLVERFAAPDRLGCARTILAAATDEPRLGFVQLLDPEGETLHGPSALPEHWAVFLLVPVDERSVLEILAGPSAATYLFRSDLDAVNRDLQLLHFRRAPLALTAQQAEITPTNPYRLAFRRLEPLQRLRTVTTARLVHNESWGEGLTRALAGR